MSAGRRRVLWPASRPMPLGFGMAIFAEVLGLWEQIVPAERGYVRPHPGPLPQERENRRQPHDHTVIPVDQGDGTQCLHDGSGQETGAYPSGIGRPACRGGRHLAGSSGGLEAHELFNVSSDRMALSPGETPGSTAGQRLAATMPGEGAFGAGGYVPLRRSPSPKAVSPLPLCHRHSKSRAPIPIPRPGLTYLYLGQLRDFKGLTGHDRLPRER